MQEPYKHNDDVQQLALRAKQGDQQAFEQLAENFKNLVRSVANSYYLVGGNKDDLFQEGLLGLFLAINNYDETKGAFPSFARLCIRNKILDAVNKDQADKNKPLSNYQEISQAESIPDARTPLDDVLGKEYAAKVAQAIQTKLSPMERNVSLLFAEGYSYEDIAAKIGKSEKSVGKALERARAKLADVSD